MGIFGSLNNLGKAAQSLGRDMFGLEIKSNSKIANIAKESGVTLDTLETAPLETLSDILNTAARQRLLDPRFANSINIQIAKDAQAAMPAMPTLKIDNPGGDWLQSKLRYAQAARDDAEPNTYRSTLGTGEGVTGYFTERLRLDPTTLANVAGSVGEERYRPDANKMSRLRQSIAETGYEESPILIHVREDGVPFVVEGNHRIIEGIESGRPTIPVEINYLRGAEDVDGPLSPESLGVPR